MPSHLRTIVRSAARKPAKKRTADRGRDAPTIGGMQIAKALKDFVPIFAMKEQIRAQLYYENALTITGTAGVLSKYVFSANGAYDPNITGTGHQPVGWDTMMLSFEHAVVLRSSIRVMFMSTTASTSRCAITLLPDTTTPGSISEAVENGLTVMTFVNGQNSTSSGNFHQMKELELHCDVPKYFGKTRQEIISSPEMYCTAAANPTEQVYFTILCWGMDANTYLNAIDVVLEYEIFYYEPRRLAVSSSSNRRVNESKCVETTSVSSRPSTSSSQLVKPEKKTVTLTMSR